MIVKFTSKFFSFLFLGLLVLSFLFFVPSVRGASGDITIVDWDNNGVGSSFNLGATSGSNSNMTYKLTGSGSLITTGGLSDKCAKIKENTVGNLYVNFTQTYSYVSSISFWIKHFSTDYSISVYDNNDVLVLYVFHDIGNPGTLYYDPVDAGLTSFSSVAGSTTSGYVNITHVADNLMNYSYDGGGSVQSDDGASCVLDSWGNISRIVINQLGGTGDYYVLVDDIIINTESIFGSGSGSETVAIRFFDMYSGEQLSFIPTDSQGPFLPGSTLMDWSIFIINGNVITDATMSLESCGYCGILTLNMSSINTGDNLYINIINPFCKSYYGTFASISYNTYQNNFTYIPGMTIDIFLIPYRGNIDPVVGPPSVADLNTYKTNFGDFFIQFYDWDDLCRYRVGDYPYIIYNLSDAYFSNDADGYEYHIMKNGVYWREGIINFVGIGSNYTLRFYLPFSEVGEYQILLYNLTDDNNFAGFVYSSMPIIVCPALNVVPPVYDDVYSYDYLPLIGFVLAFSMGFIGMYAGGGGLGFLSGFFGSIVVFSIPGTPMTFFPPVLLFVVGMLVIVVFMFILIRR